MTPRLLSLSVLCLGLMAGCAKQSPTPENPMPDESTAESAQPSQPESPSGGTPMTGTEQAAQPKAYVVRDSGVRCFTTPCPSYTAMPVNDPGGDAIQIHELEFGDMNLTQDKVEGYMLQASQGAGLKVEATLEVKPKAGPAGDATVLRVKQVLQ